MVFYLDVTGSSYSKWQVRKWVISPILVNGVFRGVISYNSLILTFYTFPGTSNYLVRTKKRI